MLVISSFHPRLGMLALVMEDESLPARSTRVSLPCMTDPQGRCLCTVRIVRLWSPGQTLLCQLHNLAIARCH